MTAYWAQFSSQEINDMHGVEENNHEEEIDESDYMDNDEQEDDEDRCPRCGGCGCNFCLMLDY